MESVPGGTDEEGGNAARVAVFRGSQADGLEFGLVLDARGITYERRASEGGWLLLVAPSAAADARDELLRYSAESAQRRQVPAPLVPRGGSAAAAAVYSLVLLAVAYAAGVHLFDVDWFDAGALVAPVGAPPEWWRALTALTLHLDQAHLFGNLLFGLGIGVLAGRVFGSGFAWFAIVLAGAAGNAVELMVSPPWHRAVGASTALFAALGLMSGFGWGRSPATRDRGLSHWAPVFGGVCLLALLGAGNAQVDVLGHVLGFLSGGALGWGVARAGFPWRTGAAFQAVSGVLALLLLAVAWTLALRG